MNALSQKRIDWIDMAKGYGIIFVILSHLKLGVPSSWMLSFNLPLFFFLSGFVFSTKDKFPVFLKKKCKSLLLPYLYLGIPIFLFTVFSNTIQDRKYLNASNITELLKDFILQQRLWTIWFLTCLFLLEIIFYLLLKKVKNKIAISIISILMPFIALIYYKFGGIPLFWNIDTCFVVIPFFCFGYLCRCNNKQFENILFTKKRKLPMLGIFIFLNVTTYVLNIILTDKPFNLFYNSFGNPILTFISAFSGILAVVIFSYITTLNPIKFIGRNSILYFGLHQSIFIPISEDILSKINLTMDSSIPEKVLYHSMQFIIIMLSITIIQLIINKIKGSSRKVVG